MLVQGNLQPQQEYAYMVRRYGWSQKGCDLFQFSRLVTDEARGPWFMVTHVSFRFIIELFCCL